MTLPIILLLALAIATAILFTILRVVRGGMVSLMTKTLASFCFVLLGVVVVFHKPILDVAMFIILGLICGMIGDILLDLKSVDQSRADAYLNFGMLAFGIGHIFYVLFMSFLSGKNVLVEALIAGAFAIVFTLAVVFFSKQLLGLKLGKFVIQAGSYACMLSFAAAFAVALAFTLSFLWPLAIALVAFWLSDIVLSIMYFGGKSENKFLSILNHVLYYGAQIAIAMFVVTL